MTRPEGSNASFVDQIAADVMARLDVIESPLIGIEPLGTPIELSAGAVAIFTSSNGVRFAPQGAGRAAYCLGRRTTQTAEAAGWRATFAGQTAAELVRFITAAHPAGNLHHLCGVHVRGDVVADLVAAGLKARRAVIYDQPLLPLNARAKDALAGNSHVLVPLFSPRAAAHFAASVPANPAVRIATLSAAVSESLGKAPFGEVMTATSPTSQAIAKCIEKLARAVALG
ncbi:uroporphyrinogen-III synthase [Roseobacter weihaiensis]|uniref:uroporphyrinogen-III synthase n=1 Tax=Roseobacter weihaiensis TaxID=2763262 RepID=UPI001D0BA9FE|nr:uroporphyrinogen-III synthase [Roseobacter sp. H9]